jgi:predicted SAM-dependent methyltransferase
MRSSNLNLGCGNRFHPDWENLDFSPVAPAVRACDLRKGIPFPDASFSVVYHSHVLEHFSKNAGAGFLRECYRVLKPGGIIRVAVPDLQRIAALYLEAFDKASQGIPGWADNYDWMLLEMYDQTVRMRTCGELVEYFRRDPIPNWNFVHQRWGVQADILLKALRVTEEPAEQVPAPSGRAWGYVFRNPGTVLRNKLARLILGEDDWRALQVARFRNQGEIHQWMYDEYSLGRLLKDVGFADTQRFSAAESQIPQWSNFHLDSEPDGTVYKPDSLYMEGTKL